MKHFAFAFVAVVAPVQAQAYCIYNELKDRSVSVEQDEHPDKARNERRLRATIAPGQTLCCKFHDLDCNPLGRDSSIVDLAIRIAGEPSYACGFPPGAADVKVTGNGAVRVMPNPRRASTSPYILRIRTHDGKDITGPRGLACPETRTKGKQ